MSAQQTAQDTEHSNSPIRDGVATPPAAGGDAIVSTHTKTEEEQARRYCCIFGRPAIPPFQGGRVLTRLSLGKLLVNLLQVVKRSNTPLIP